MKEEIERVATRIRDWRVEARLTLQQLAEISGVSASTIHKIENHQTMPTVVILIKVAKGLNRRPSELFEEAAAGGRFAVRRHWEQKVVSMEGQGAVTPLAGMISNNKLDLWRVSLLSGVGPKEGSGEVWQYKRELVILVEDGSIEFRIGGETLSLGAGDSIHFDTTLPHSWITLGDRAVQFICLAASSSDFQDGFPDLVSANVGRLPPKKGK